MLKPKFYATIKDGKISFDDGEQKNLDIYLQRFEEMQEIEMTVARKYKRRTSNQPGEETNFNGYFWLIMQFLADELGYFDKRKMADDVLMEIGHSEINRFGKMVAKQTRDLSGGEFAEMCSKIRMWASSELNIFLPEPHEFALTDRYGYSVIRCPINYEPKEKAELESKKKIQNLLF